MRHIFFVVCFALTCLGRGVAQECRDLGDSGVVVATFRWAANSSGFVRDVALACPFSIDGLRLLQIETQPLAPAPTSGYGVQVVDQFGADVMAGSLRDLSASKSQIFGTPVNAPPIYGVLSIRLSGNAVPRARGVVVAYLARTAFAPANSSGNGPGSGVLNTAAYIFTPQAPGGTLHAGVKAAVRLSPCPSGLNGGDTLHPLYISGGMGEAEAVTIAGGSCISGASAGTVAFTPAHTHRGAWSIASATAGIRECFEDAGAGGACYTPSGTWNIYATLYNDHLVTWYGDGNTSIVQIQFSGSDGIVIGPPSFTGTFVTIRNLKAAYGVGQGVFAPSNALWVFRNLADGEVSGLESFLGYTGFEISGSVRVKYSNLYSNASKYAYYWPAGSINNAGQFANFYGTVQAYGTAMQFEGTLSGLALSNFLIEAAGARGTYGMVFNPTAGNVVNEVEVSNANVDSFGVNALAFKYAASDRQNYGSTLHFSNIRFVATGTQPVALLNAPYFGLKFDNCAFYNDGTGDGLALAGITRSTFTAIHADVTARAADRLLLKLASAARR